MHPLARFLDKSDIISSALPPFPLRLCGNFFTKHFHLKIACEMCTLIQLHACRLRSIFPISMRFSFGGLRATHLPYKSSHFYLTFC